MTFDRLCAALFLLAVGTAACLMPAQSDTWWQLRAGEEIWRTHTIPLTDSFSHTVAGTYWPDHEWLSQALFFGLYRLGGLRLLNAVAAALVLGAWAIAWRLSPRGGIRKVTLFSFAVLPASMAWSLRPQVLTLFLLALTVFLLVRQYYAALPVVFVVWANLHGAVILGLVALLAAIAAAAFDDLRLFVRLVIVTLVCILATAITPLGFSLWHDIPTSVGRLRQYGVLEWRPPRFDDLPFLPFWGLAAAFVALIVGKKPWRSNGLRRNPLIWAGLAMLPLGVASGRNIPPLMLLVTPAIATLSAPTLSAAKANRSERPGLNVAVFAAATLIACALVVYAWTFQVSRLHWHPLPDETIAAIGSCPEHLYNRFDEGGYLIWFARDRKIFIDSRLDPYPPEFVLEHIRVETSGDYEETFHRYGIHCAFIPRDSLLSRRLEDAGWTHLSDAEGWVVLADFSALARESS